MSLEEALSSEPWVDPNAPPMREYPPDPGEPVSLRGIFPRRFSRAAPAGFGFAAGMLARVKAKLAKGTWKEELRRRCRDKSPAPMSRAAVFDEAGQIRALTKKGGSDDSAWTVAELYDEQEQLRFLFIQHASVDGSAGEYLVSFSVSGAVVACNQLILGRPGYDLCAADPAEVEVDVARFADSYPRGAFDRCLPEREGDE